MVCGDVWCPIKMSPWCDRVWLSLTRPLAARAVSHCSLALLSPDQPLSWPSAVKARGRSTTWNIGTNSYTANTVTNTDNTNWSVNRETILNHVRHTFIIQCYSLQEQFCQDTRESLLHHQRREEEVTEDLSHQGCVRKETVRWENVPTEIINLVLYTTVLSPPGIEWWYDNVQIYESSYS